MTQPPEPFYSYTIYDRPTDYPDKFVVRKFNWDQPLELMGTAPNLELARLLVPSGMTCMTRLPEDDPKIVEVWI